MATSFEQKVLKRLSYITMMGGCGFVVGTQRHTALVQETANGIGDLIKNTKEIGPDTGVEVNEILKAKLDQRLVDNLMSLLHTKVSLSNGGPNGSKQMIKFLDNYCTGPHWDALQDPNTQPRSKLMCVWRH